MSEVKPDSPSEVTQKDNRTMKDLLEEVSKIGFLIFFTCYAIGLLIINLHLAQYGIYHLGFLQIDYVMAGALWLFLVLGTLSCFLHIKDIIKDGWTNWNDGKISKVLKIIGPLLVIFFVVLFFQIVLDKVTVEPLNYSSWETWQIVGNLIVSAVAVSWLKSDFNNIYKTLINTDKKTIGTILYRMADRIIWILGIIAWFALFTYPKLNPAFGGGKKQVVEFIVKQDSIPAFTNFGLKLQENSVKSEPLEIVFEDSDYFYLLPPNNADNSNSAIRIKKDLLDGTIYKTPPKKEWSWH